jgi:hypothetical protein
MYPDAKIFKSRARKYQKSVKKNFNKKNKNHIQKYTYAQRS